MEVKESSDVDGQKNVCKCTFNKHILIMPWSYGVTTVHFPIQYAHFSVRIYFICD